MKKLLVLLGIIAALIVAGISGQIGREVGKSTFAASKLSAQEVEAKLVEGLKIAANQFNQKLPMMLDSNTRLDRATVGPGVRMVYHHTLPGYTSKDIDSNLLRNTLRPEVMRNVCSSSEMKKSLQFGGIYAYAYYGSDGVEIAQFEIDRSDCGFSKISP